MKSPFRRRENEISRKSGIGKPAVVNRSSRRKSVLSLAFDQLELRRLLAVTTTYAFDFVQDTALTQGPSTSQANATSLADGGFAVSGTHIGHTDIDIFNGDLSDAGGSNVNTGSDSAIDQLTNGNLVYVTEDADSILYGIVSSTGAVVVSATDIGDADSSNPDVAALTGGRFVIVNEDEIGAVGGDSDIDVRIRNPDGTSVTFLVVDASLERDVRAAVAPLDNGNFVVAWQRDVDASVDTEIWYAIYDPNGATVKSPAIADSIGSVNRNVDVSPKENGFALVYEDSGWGTGTNDITMAEFSLDGTFQTWSNISNPTFVDDGSDDANPAVARLSNGFLVIGYENNAFSDTDSHVALFDAATNEVLTSRNITGGESVVDDVGEISLAGSASGRVNVFQTNFDDAAINGETIAGKRTSIGDGANDTVDGDEFVDIMHGNGGNDTFRGFASDDTLNGGDGNDSLNGGGGDDTLNGDGNDDSLIGRGGADSMNGGGGLDTANYVNSPAGVNVNLSTGVATGSEAQGDTFSSVERLRGSAFADILSGNNIANRVAGGDGADTINGGNGDDILLGDNGNDKLNGGANVDQLTGGVGADWFIFSQLSHSGFNALRDRITDFVKAQLDKINVSNIDGKAGTIGVNGFDSFIGNAAFTAEGQIRAFQSGPHTVVEFNTTGATGAEMQIQLNNFNAGTLALSDFIVAAGIPPSNFKGGGGNGGGGYPPWGFIIQPSSSNDPVKYSITKSSQSFTHNSSQSTGFLMPIGHEGHHTDLSPSDSSADWFRGIALWSRSTIADRELNFDACSRLIGLALTDQLFSDLD